MKKSGNLFNDPRTYINIYIYIYIYMYIYINMKLFSLHIVISYAVFFGKTSYYADMSVLSLQIRFTNFFFLSKLKMTLKYHG